MSSGNEEFNNGENDNQHDDANSLHRQYLRNPTSYTGRRGKTMTTEERKQEAERAARLAAWLNGKQETSGRSVRDVANDIGVAHVTLRSWLLGHNLPSSDAARKLARYYKVDEDWLLEMSGHRTSRQVSELDPERQEFLMWANANVEKIPVKQLRALRRMMEELAAEE